MVDEELSFTHLILNQDSILVDDIEGRKEGKLISLTTDQALKYQIADGVAEDINFVLDSLGYKSIQIVEKSENWSEDIVRFLTNPVVASLLTTFGFLGILFELQSPGWGIPGFVGLTCLILSLSASYIAQLATMSDLLFVFAGIGMVLVEILAIPGFGIIGIGGFGLMIYGLYLLLLPDIPVGDEIVGQAMDGFYRVSWIYHWINIFGKIHDKNKVLETANFSRGSKKIDGFSNSFSWESFKGKDGIADTDLHPSGWIRVENERVFVVSEGDFIERCKN